MPEEYQQKKLTDAEKLTINYLLKGEERFYATSFKGVDNKEFMKSDRYDIEAVTQNAELIQRMLEIPSTKDVTISASERTNLELNLARRQSFLLLNDEKSITSDSKEMAKVKKTLEALETTLQTEEYMNDKTLDNINNLYAKAIDACKYYVDNKNPWFSAGIRRKKRVQDTLDKLTKEKDLFERGVSLVKEGFVDLTKIKSPYELIESERVKELQEKIDEEENARQEQQWRDEVAKEIGFDKDFEEFKKSNHMVKDKDKDKALIVSLLYKIDVKGSEGLPPIINKEVGIAKRLAAKGKELGVCDTGDATRIFAGDIYYVKRNKTGKPINKKEEEKAQKNAAWEKICDDYLDAQAAVKNAPNDKEKAKTLKDKKLKLFELHMERFHEFVKKFDFPSVEQIKKDPYSLEQLMLKDPSTFSFLIHGAGQWVGIRQFVGDDIVDEYMKNHPLDKFITTIHGSYSAIINSLLGMHAHLDLKNGKALPYTHDAEASLDKLKNDPNSTQEQIQGMKESCDGNISDFEDLLTLTKEETYSEDDAALLHKILKKRAHQQNTEYEEWQLANGIAKEAKELADNRTKEGVKTTPEIAEMQLALEQASKSKYRSYHPDIAEIQTRIEKSKGLSEGRFDGNMGREVGCLCYVPKFNKDGEPLNEEEKQKHEWNKKWMECFIKGADKEVKKKMMEEGIKRILSIPVPTPEEIRKKGAFNLVKENPFLYYQIMQHPIGLDNLREDEPEMYKEIMQKDPSLYLKLDMLYCLSDHLKTELKQEPYNIDAMNNFKFLSVSEVKEIEFVNKHSPEQYKDQLIQKRRIREDYQRQYHQAQNADAMQKLKEQVLTPEFIDKKLKEARAKDPSITRDAILIQEASKLCNDQLNDLEKILERVVGLKLVDDGDASRLATCGIYYIKKDAKGNPINEEEKRKALHNDKMKAAWKRFLDAKDPKSKLKPSEAVAEEKKARRALVTTFASFIRDMTKIPMPSPSEIASNPEVLRRFVLEDPFTAKTLASLALSFDKFERMFQPEMDEAKKAIPELMPFVDMCSILTGSLMTIPVTINLKLGQEKWNVELPDEKNTSDDLEEYRQTKKESIEENYNVYLDDYQKHYDKLNTEKKKIIARQLRVDQSDVLLADKNKLIRPDKEIGKLSKEYTKPGMEEYNAVRKEILDHANKENKDILKKRGSSTAGAENVRFSVAFTTAMIGLEVVKKKICLLFTKICCLPNCMKILQIVRERML
jgi:hypothetical protein